MNPVGVAHVASIPVMAFLVAVIFTINIQGPRKALANETVARGALRRFLKIVGLLAYGMLAVHLLTLAARAPGGSFDRKLWAGLMLLQVGPIVLYLGLTILLWLLGAIIGVDLEGKLYAAIRRARSKKSGAPDEPPAPPAEAKNADA